MKPASLVRVRRVPQELAWQIGFSEQEIACRDRGTTHERDLCPHVLALEYADWRTAHGMDPTPEFLRLEREFRCMAQVTPFPVLALIHSPR